jgi:hypothetical protein
VVRYCTAVMVSLAVLATAFVGVRLHHDVAALRYAVYELDAERGRAERELRLAQAEYETAKSPRRLLERWSEVVVAAWVPVPPPAAATQPAQEDAPSVEPEAQSPVEGPRAPSPVEGDR